MNKQQKKREVPSLLRKVLASDAYLTDKFVKTVERSLPLRQLKVHYKMLEISCHGIPWLAGWLAFIWVLNNKNLYQMQVNFMIGFLLDIVIVAVIKALTRRRRPAVNDDPFALGPDKFSFPSGHVTRATFMVYFFLNLWTVNIIFVPPLLAWATSVSLSRLLLRRHYLLDVFAGVIIGLMEGAFLSLIYLEEETCIGLISWISDEKIEGAEYHV